VSHLIDFWHEHEYVPYKHEGRWLAGTATLEDALIGLEVVRRGESLALHDFGSEPPDPMRFGAANAAQHVIGDYYDQLSERVRYATGVPRVYVDGYPTPVVA
jgi:hypothetical protein